MKKYNTPTVELIEAPDVVTMSDESTKVDTGKFPFISSGDATDYNL